MTRATCLHSFRPTTPSRGCTAATGSSAGAAQRSSVRPVADRFTEASEWWRELAAHAVVRDDVDVPGSGLVTFGSFTFSDDADGSVLVVPEVVVGRRDGVAWITVIGLGIAASPDLAMSPASPPADGTTFADGPVDSVTGRAWWRRPSTASPPASSTRSCWLATWSPRSPSRSTYAHR